ncbi:M23 family metallopeptidase [Burkholderia guangdongensis]|uniref:M23 family metallopeptidase n=1 Tax=Burkholderia guangdongensis TaxID=1792500 RepID=UPI0015C9C680|nr:M23 family metallopeptidase [Burkholderia guangdongensis]
MWTPLVKSVTYPDARAPMAGRARLPAIVLGAVAVLGLALALPALSSAPDVTETRAAALPQRVLSDTPFPTAQHFVTDELAQMTGERSPSPGLLAPLAAHRDDVLGSASLFALASAESGHGLRAGNVELTLSDTLNRLDLPPEVAIQLGDLVSGKIPMHADAQPGDRYRIAFDSVDGTPRVTALELHVAGRTFGAVWFVPPGATQGAYYTFDGAPLEAAAFEMPVQWTRISSPFGERIHPLTHQAEFHTGVDLVAPTGTPVDAAADGVVAFVGVDPGGYGRYVIVDHASHYSTYYAHLSAFAPGLKVGDTVRQGERIGAVGMSGEATGPHLHFEVRIADQPVDPIVTLANAQTALSAMQLTAFRVEAAQWRFRFASIGTSPFAFAQADGPLWGDFAAGMSTTSTLRAMFDARYGDVA